MRPLLLAALILGACALSADPSPGEPRDPGGNVVLRAAEVARLELLGLPKRVSGECLSACTLYLGLSTACFEEGAVLGFHGPRAPRGDLAEPSFEVASRLMARFYPPRLAAWFLAEGRYAEEMVRIPAADLVARGEARACPPRG